MPADFICLSNAVRGSHTRKLSQKLDKVTFVLNFADELRKIVPVK